MKKSYLKPESDVWFYFTIYDLFTMNMMGMGEKKPEIYTGEKQEKIPHLVALPSPRLWNWRPTVFWGERTENKPDLP